MYEWCRVGTPTTLLPRYSVCIKRLEWNMDFGMHRMFAACVPRKSMSAALSVRGSGRASQLLPWSTRQCRHLISDSFGLRYGFLFFFFSFFFFSFLSLLLHYSDGLVDRLVHPHHPVHEILGIYIYSCVADHFAS